MNVGWPQCRPKWRCIGTSYASSSNILKAAHHALPAVKKPKYLVIDQGVGVGVD